MPAEASLGTCVGGVVTGRSIDIVNRGPAVGLPWNRGVMVYDGCRGSGNLPGGGSGLMESMKMISV
jgi:hypothetical protein